MSWYDGLSVRCFSFGRYRGSAFLSDVRVSTKASGIEDSMVKLSSVSLSAVVSSAAWMSCDCG